MQALKFNLLSASTVILGTVVVMFLYNSADEYVWVLVGLAAGNMLYLSASDLLPRIHVNLSHYGSIWHSTIAIAVGFVLMTTLLSWVHGNPEFGLAHDHEHDYETELADEYENEGEHGREIH